MTLLSVCYQAQCVAGPHLLEAILSAQVCGSKQAHFYWASHPRIDWKWLQWELTNRRQSPERRSRLHKNTGIVPSSSDRVRSRLDGIEEISLISF